LTAGSVLLLFRLTE